MIRFKLVILLFLLSLITSCRNQATDETFPCDGVFYLNIEGNNGKQVCSKTIENYHIHNNKLIFSVLNNELAGKVIFQIELEPFDGPGLYQLGKNYQNKCELIVQGASDEFYKCTSGTFTVHEAGPENLNAIFDIVIEGFYNKKVIHAQGGVHL
ncbi:MAG: hypothetical protein KJ578_10155 [Bacteroidetes bacterium]|nr:hypothetical protein [Bacteroidota bacterium]MBU1580303.1 hypothetical protein [Bacteroidota bacterium]MBU2466317.1 hypothetical protein [Bacteroidota bacterium]MBU2558127.1 hypothetical protein [Bacteroidota bacterium]